MSSKCGYHRFDRKEKLACNILHNVAETGCALLWSTIHSQRSPHYRDLLDMFAVAPHVIR